jgi:hypothetical protein
VELTFVQFNTFYRTNNRCHNGSTLDNTANGTCEFDIFQEKIIVRKRPVDPDRRHLKQQMVDGVSNCTTAKGSFKPIRSDQIDREKTWRIFSAFYLTNQRSVKWVKECACGADMW